MLGSPTGITHFIGPQAPEIQVRGLLNLSSMAPSYLEAWTWVTLSPFLKQPVEKVVWGEVAEGASLEQMQSFSSLK